MSCSRTQHGGGRFRTPDLSFRSPTLYHWATALPVCPVICSWLKVANLDIHIHSNYSRGNLDVDFTTISISPRFCLSHVMRKPVFAICEQQRRSSAWASTQSDQRLYCSLPRQYDTSNFYIRNFKTLASLCLWAGRFESFPRYGALFI